MCVVCVCIAVPCTPKSRCVHVYYHSTLSPNVTSIYPHTHTGQEFFAVEVAANSLVSSNEACMRLIRQAARALYNETFPSGMSHLCRPPTQIPMKWWPRETLRAGEVIHILGEFVTCVREGFVCHTCTQVMCIKHMF